MTSFTPLRPRSASERRNLVQKTSASEAPVATPSTIDGQEAIDPIAKRAAPGRRGRAAAVGVDGHGAPATFHVAELQGVPGRERPGGTATLTIRPPWRDLR